jgi:hypothetical protein
MNQQARVFSFFETSPIKYKQLFFKELKLHLQENVQLVEQTPASFQHQGS